MVRYDGLKRDAYIRYSIRCASYTYMRNGWEVIVCTNLTGIFAKNVANEFTAISTVQNFTIVQVVVK